MDERAALREKISASAWAQLAQLQSTFRPGREPPTVESGWLYVAANGSFLTGDPVSGAVTLAPAARAPLLRLSSPDGSVRFVLLRADGTKKFLHGDTDAGAVSLTADANLATVWKMDQAIPVQLSPFTIVARNHGTRPALAHSIDGVQMVQGGAPYTAGTLYWHWSNTPTLPLKPVPPAPQPYISAQAFWWGFHLVIPHELIEQWKTTGLAIAEFMSAIAGETGPAAPFVEAAAATVAADMAVYVDVDRGNGISVSMCWFAPGIFVPTTR